MSVPNVVPIHPVQVEIFHWISDNSDVMVLPEEKSGDQLSR